MKRVIPTLLLAGLLAGCAGPAAETPTPQPTEPPVTETPVVETPSPFDIRTPIVFASYFLQPESKVYKTLILECISGSYTSAKENWNQAWSGTFQFRLADGPSVSLTDEGGVTSCKMELSFNGPFYLYVDDYNDDGQPDFALTQWGSYSGGDYGKIFTLQPDGTVTELPVTGDQRAIYSFGTIDDSEGDTGCFLIPHRHFSGSAELTKTEGGFLVRTEQPFIRGPLDDGIYFMGQTTDNWEYAELEGVYLWDATALEDIYLWDGSAFVLSEQRLIYEAQEDE